MEYIKLIALNIDDFSSSIFFENNYTLTDIEKAKSDKRELEIKGYLCMLANTKCNIQF